MRRTIQLFLLGMVVSVSAVGAQERNRHLLYLSVQGEYANLLHSIAQTMSVGGAGGGLGFGYEYQRHSFFASIGLSFDYAFADTRLSPGTLSHEGTGSQGKPCTYYYRFDDAVSRTQYGYMRIPVMFGGKWRAVYAQAGIKAGINCVASTTASAHYEVSALYPTAIGAFSDMPNHGLTAQTIESDGKLSLGMDLAASVEIGANMEHKKATYRIGVFVDYGFVNVNRSASNRPLFSILPSVPDVEMSPLFVSSDAKDKAVNPLSVGIRFTVLFNVSVPDCHCLPKYSYKRRGKVKI
ncbi:MAG: hypothetical protein ACI392_00785 [Paludibacteraceae bacterium]